MSASIASSDIFYVVFLGATTGTVNPQAGSVGSSQITSEMITGLPALSITGGKNVNKLPIGIQVIGKPFDEVSVLAAGKLIEDCRGF